jgi:L-lactate dehydrogenase complex protein LldF
MTDHSTAANAFTRNDARVNWHDASLWLIRKKRDAAAGTVEGWEELRTLASDIKAHTLSKLDEYLVQFETAAAGNGVKVHWAVDAAAHNETVLEILRSRGATKLVKSKSMLTEECGLNEFLAHRGIEVIDTDLGERIVQLAQEPPSHIVMPAIHKTKEEIDKLFHEHLHTELSGGDEVYLTRAARAHLREKFLNADAALTGVNFAVAETGAIVVCTNEGNADMGVHAAPIHIACMGIEKVIPSLEHLGVFLRLLARSATGQPITTYTSMYTSPAAGRELHLVIVDNGRSKQLARPEFRASLKCIRCGACMNTCPVYRRSGGHSYGFTIPGPIGSVLAPGVDPDVYRSLPFASTLCGSCTDVCPVKIDLHTELYRWRQELTRRDRSWTMKKAIMGFAAGIFSRPTVYRAVSTIGAMLLRVMPRTLTNGLFGSWTDDREWPTAPKQTFSQWHRKRRQ